jgi:toxin-antitoxin system PIN domain toxin
MKIIDANLLIYAINKDTPHHAKAKKWFEEAIEDTEPIGLAWIVILAFMRITTNDRILPHPLVSSQVFRIVEDWLGMPSVRVVSTTERHWAILKDLLEQVGTAGNLTSDAHLAALTIEHSAYLYSTDNDFSRFRGLRWRNPIA